MGAVNDRSQARAALNSRIYLLVKGGLLIHFNYNSVNKTNKGALFAQNGIDNNLLTFGVFLDFAKAFDTVNYVVLLKKLEMHGIR